MHLLLDTHTFLWAVMDHPDLSRTAADLILDSGNEIFVSSGSMWEIAIKEGSGKLEISVPRPFDVFLQEHLGALSADVLPINLQHLETYIRLPFHHRDPFDRLFIAQAKVEGFIILTKDRHFTPYEVSIQW